MMNKYTTTQTLLVPTMLLSLASAPLEAATFTVRATDDPAVPNPSTCTAMTDACSLRDALAAADATAEHDTIVFDVDGPVHLTRKLTAATPVAIDGGGVAQVRVHQGYTIASLQDNSRFGNDILPTLQPVFENPPTGRRFMLELLASGSSVTGLHIDGSITRPAGEIAVERVDFNADGVTDYVLHTVDDRGVDVWPIVGGIRADFTSSPPVACDALPPTGTVQLSGNLLSNLGYNGINVAYHQLSDISDNEIRGGAWGQPGFNSDGIYMFCGAGATVSGNEVSGYRNGISLVVATATSMTDNEVRFNRYGLEIEGWNGFFGPNLVTRNESAHNTELGMLMLFTGATYVVDNEVRDNGSDPMAQGGLALIASDANHIEANRASGNSGFGIVVDRSSDNDLFDNEAEDNTFGIVLVNDAHGNEIAGNETASNGVGILMSRTVDGQPYPSDNTVADNEAENNLGIDLLDEDPVCNDDWSGNAFDSAFAASGNCID